MSAPQAPATVSLYSDCHRGLHVTHTHTLVQRLGVAIRDGFQSLSSGLALVASQQAPGSWSQVKLQQ